MHLRFDRAGRLTHLVHSGSSCLWVIHASRRRDHGNTGPPGMMKLRRTWHMADPRTTLQTTQTSFFSRRGASKMLRDCERKNRQCNQCCKKYSSLQVWATVRCAQSCKHYHCDQYTVNDPNTSTRRWQIERWDVSASPTYSVIYCVSGLASWYHWFGEREEGRMRSQGESGWPADGLRRRQRERGTRCIADSGTRLCLC